MGVEVTITLAELDRARALLVEAHAKGYRASVAVLTVVRAGRCIGDCIVESDGLLLTAGSASTDYGRQSSAAHFAPPSVRTCQHRYAGGSGGPSDQVYCGKPAKKLVRQMGPGNTDIVVCGVHARFWAARKVEPEDLP